MRLLVATRNRHKLAEIREILSVPGLEWLDLAGHPEVAPVVEDAASLAGNAVKKAVSAALCVREWTLSDDSGLEVDALDGAPGVTSARFAGEPANDAANNARLLECLRGIENRTARFRCVIALSSPSGAARVVEGVCEGVLLREPRGTGGFGYDPLFVPEGHEVTFAELGPAVKNSLSHRARALRAALGAWESVLASDLRDWPPRSSGHRLARPAVSFRL